MVYFQPQFLSYTKNTKAQEPNIIFNKNTSIVHYHTDETHDDNHNDDNIDYNRDSDD